MSLSFCRQMTHYVLQKHNTLYITKTRSFCMYTLTSDDMLCMPICI